MKNEIASLLAHHVREQGVTGASFACWDGNRLHLAVAGARNSVTGDPVTTDTLMHIGSITKIANVVLLLQMVDDGLIHLEDPVTKHLPELKLKDSQALEQMTVAMLVNHTSGINGEMLPDRGPDRERIVDLIDRCGELGQIHPPGAGPSYCNTATVIAGYLTEKLRGRSWHRLAKERIFEPLGMTHSITDPVETVRFRCSIGDLTNPSTGELVQSSRPFLPLSYAPCGTTAMTTAEELVTLGRALADGGVGPNGHRILSEEMTRRMATPTARIVVPELGHWGLGWMILQGGILYHAGGGPGVSSHLFVHQPTGRALTLLTNCDRGASLLPGVVKPIVEEWTGSPWPEESTESANLVDATPYLGAYGNNAVQITVSSGPLGLAVDSKMAWPLYDRGDQPTPKIDILPSGPDRFFTVGPNFAMPSQYLFERGADGGVTRLFHNLRIYRRITQEIPS